VAEVRAHQLGRKIKIALAGIIEKINTLCIGDQQWRLPALLPIPRPICVLGHFLYSIFNLTH
jgi:hypothetical protein